MMTKDEALKMAIEALEMHVPYYIKDKGCDALIACKEALEQPTMSYEDGFAHGYEAHRVEQENDKQESIVTLWDALTDEQPSQEPMALLEELSDLEHQQWIKWAQSIIDSEPISEARKQRWLTMMVDYKDLPDNIQEYDREWARKVMALYTHPAPSWQGLSDAELLQCMGNGAIRLPIGWQQVARAIEQALKEKNT